MKARIWVVAALCVVLLAICLRARGLRKWALNNDEIAEVSWSSQSFGDMMDAVRFDAVHPPLDYFLQYAISHAHWPEWIHRLPPAICGVLTIVTVMCLGYLWSGRVAAVAAGFLLALAPMHVRYSQEVRPYSMALFFVCGSLLALEMYARSQRRRWAITWFVMVLLAGGTLYFAGMVAGAASLFRIAIDRKGSLIGLWRRLPYIMAGWTLLYAPWLRVVFTLGRRTSPMKADKLQLWWWQHRAQTLATGDWIFEPLSYGSWAFWGCVALGIAMAFRYRALATAAFWFVAGTALEIVVLQWHPHYSTPRYLMPSWPAAFILAGAAIGVLWSRLPARPIAVAVLLLFAAHSVLTLEQYFHGERSDWRSVADFVHGRVRSGDTIVLTNNWVDRNFVFYWRQMPPLPDVKVVMYEPLPTPLKGPVWVVTAQCRPEAVLEQRDLMHYWEITEEARVFEVRAPRELPMDSALCPE